MQLFARTLRFFANRFLADPPGSSQSTARRNAAEASAHLRARRHEQADVDTYLHAQRMAYRGDEGTQTSQGWSDVENTS